VAEQFSYILARVCSQICQAFFHWSVKNHRRKKSAKFGDLMFEPVKHIYSTVIILESIAKFIANGVFFIISTVR
jgi:hypothetical protein